MKERERMETGEGFKQFAWCALTLEGKVVIWRIAKGEGLRKVERSHRMLLNHYEFQNWIGEWLNAW